MYVSQSLRACVVVTALMVTTAVLTPAAHAEGIGAPVIVAPTDGQVVDPGFAGPVSLDFTDAPSGDYTVDVANQTSAYHQVDHLTVDSNTPLRDVAIAAVQTPGSYTVSVDYDADSDPAHTATRTFLVRDDAPEPTPTPTPTPVPPLAFTGVSVSSLRFYPLVQDGFRDSRVVRFTTNEPVRVTARVRTLSGSLVRTATFTSRAGAGSWAWYGGKNGGGHARPGAYRIDLTATGTVSGDRVRRFTGRVNLATGWRYGSGSSSRPGNAYSTQSAGSDCYTTEDDYLETVTVDCWGGRSGVGYRFAVPRNTYSVSWRVSGVTQCCAPGRIIRTGTRISPTRFRVGVVVTDWRAYEVHRVRISYRTRTRI